MHPTTITGGTEAFASATPHTVQTLLRIWDYLPVSIWDSM